MENQKQNMDKPKLSVKVAEFIKQYVFVVGILFGIISPQLAKYYDKVIASGVSPNSWELSLALCAIAIIVGAVIGITIVVIYNKMHGMPIECGDKIECTTRQISSANSLVNRIREIKDTEIRTLISQQIIDDDALQQLEKRADCGSKIFVMSSNFKWEQKQESITSIVENLVQGVEYRYIIPRTENRDQFEAMLKQMYTIFKTKQNKLGLNNNDKINGIFLSRFKAVWVENDFVFLTTVLYQISDSDNEVIVKLPYEGDSEQECVGKYVYVIPKSPEIAWNALIKKISDIYHSIMNPSTPLQNSSIGDKVDIEKILEINTSIDVPRRRRKTKE